MKLKDIFHIKNEEAFKKIALEVFNYQYHQVKVYGDFCKYLKIDPEKVKEIKQIPFLPIQFFKSHQVISEKMIPEAIFSSSGTTGSITSKHFVAQLSLYEKSFTEGFKNTYGNPNEYAILALLPSYLEREGSSLIFMVEHLIRKNEQEQSGFFLNNIEELIKKLVALENKKQKTLLIGVSYALLDIIEKHTFNLKHTIVLETGGMKGKRKELIKEALHKKLKEGFGVSQIHSEYGMTELLSQAYAVRDGNFICPPWMKVLTRDPEDALTYVEGKTGGLNIIDLANYYSCSFIATQDLGKVTSDNTFKVLGRFDNSDIRGCNLMVL